MLGTILKNTHKSNRYKVLSYSTHERYQSNMKDINADFYLYRTLPQHQIRVKNWDFRYASLPKNHFLLNPVKGMDQIPKWIDFDVLLSQTKAGHIQISRQIQSMLHIPIISIEHTLPPPETPMEHLLDIKKKLSGDVNVFISKYNREKWGYTEEEGLVINHGIDTDHFKPANKERKNHILTVANEYPTRDSVLGFSQYKRVTTNLPTRPVGDSPGFSLPAKDINDLANEYQTSRIFLNTAHVSPIPMSLLEAMSSGCACVSCNTAAIPEYIKHGRNGFLASNDNEMREYLEILLSDEELANELGQEARKTIEEKCSLERFTSQWNDLLEKVINGK